MSDLHRKLLMGGHIAAGDVSYETLRKLVNRHQLLKEDENVKPRKKFEKEFNNELWMVDFKQGKSIRQGRRLNRSYLCAIIDDASRLLVGYQWGLNEDTTLFASTLKRAVSIYGIPKILYGDQAKVFRSNYLLQLCARLGISLVNAEPYSPESKAKIERFNRTVQQMFYPLIKDFHAINVEQLNHQFDTFIQEIYHQRSHASLGESPLKKYQRLIAQSSIWIINKFHRLSSSNPLTWWQMPILHTSPHLIRHYFKMKMKMKMKIGNLNFNLNLNLSPPPPANPKPKPKPKPKPFHPPGNGVDF